MPVRSVFHVSEDPPCQFPPPSKATRDFVVASTVPTALLLHSILLWTDLVLETVTSALCRSIPEVVQLSNRLRIRTCPVIFAALHLAATSQ